MPKRCLITTTGDTTDIVQIYIELYIGMNLTASTSTNYLQGGHYKSF